MARDLVAVHKRQLNVEDDEIRSVAAVAARPSAQFKEIVAGTRQQIAENPAVVVGVLDY